jgi:hypothetical protein
MRNKFDGQCFICKKPVLAGEGYFQRNTVRPDIPKKWLTRCKACVGKGNKQEQQP